MHSTTLLSLLGAGASLALAQTTTEILYIPGADIQSLVASVITSDATATTYALQCASPTATDSDDECGFDGVVTLTEGPSTAAYTFPPETDTAGGLAFTGYMDCSLYGTTSAVCIESFGGNQANDPGMSTTTYSGTDQPYMPVVITGAAAVSTPGPVAASTTTTSSEGSSTSSGTAATKTSTSSGLTKTSTGSSSAAAKTGTSTSSAGGAIITAGAKWLVGGGAAAAALAFVV